MVSGAEPDAGSSRRGLLCAAAGVAGAVLVGGCGTSSSRAPQIEVRTVPGVPSEDVPILSRLLDLEHRSIAAYTAGTPLLHAGLEQSAATQFLKQEFDHSGEVAGLMHKGGAKPQKPRESYDLGRPQTRSEVLILLHRIEREQIAAYLYAIPRVTGNSVRQALGAILGNEAQHLALIRSYQRQSPVPAALVTGRE